MEDVFPPLAKILDVVSIVTAAVAIITVFVEVTAPRSAGRAVQLPRQLQPQHLLVTAAIAITIVYVKVTPPQNVGRPVLPQHLLVTAAIAITIVYVKEIPSPSVERPVRGVTIPVLPEETRRRNVGQPVLPPRQLQPLQHKPVGPVGCLEELIEMLLKKLVLASVDIETSRPEKATATGKIEAAVLFQTGVISVQGPEGEQ